MTVDPFEGLVWAARRTSDTVNSYDRNGVFLDEAVGFSSSDKYVALVAGTMPSGLVARLSFAGNANDSSGNGFNGAVSGSAVYTADRHGVAGQALQFDGSTYVSLPADAAFSLSSFTLYTIFKSSTVTAEYAPLINKGTATGYGNYFLALFSGRGAYVEDFADGNYSGFTSDGTIASNRFVHHAVTLQGSSLLGYVNGALSSVLGEVPTPVMNDQPVIIGGHPAFEISFKGVIDEVFIFNRALSPAEVKQLYERLK
jgi:hypothetical protein